MMKIYQTLSRILENWAVFSLMEIIPVINLEFLLLQGRVNLNLKSLILLLRSHYR
jgi:hypothetical protein